MILVLNSGSSSVKYRTVDPDGPDGPDGPDAGRRGRVERIGEPGGPPDHHAALTEAFEALGPGRADLVAVGHRVVHGGARFTAPTRIDDAVMAAIRDLIPLAPLHNPGSIAGIEAARRVLPDLPHVAVFDTAFHADLPAPAATYAIDRELATRLGVRRYGFHGISVEYVADRAARLLGRPLAELDLIVLHLGNGASATAVHHGHSVETSMGLTPLEGLVMGTRSGDLDPAIVTFLQRSAGLSVDEVDDLLQHRSGLTALAGANDMRSVLAARDAGDESAALAIDVYCHRIRKYVGAYHAVLGHLDAIIFTAGVGENAPAIRAGALAGLDAWGIAVDPVRNARADGTTSGTAGRAGRVVSAPGAAVTVAVVPTDEELAIAEHVAGLIR
jgi:acetate kinase